MGCSPCVSQMKARSRYNVAMHKHDYYNQFFELGQQKINFKFYELSLPDDDPVFTLKNVMEEMDFTALLAQYSGKGKSGFNPIMKYGVLTYANMRGIHSLPSLFRQQKAFLMLCSLPFLIAVRVDNSDHLRSHR